MNNKNKLVELRKELKTVYSNIGINRSFTIRERLHKEKERLIKEINELEKDEKTFDREKHIARVKDQNNDNIYKGSDEFSKAGRLHRKYQKQEKHAIFNNSEQ
ncbi:hypothetical protein CPT_Machias_012 [Staphylococcus phage Machias]|nr:hypothetical protein CPT_Machias_012 [Staphylococcus phage Machias]WPH64164.1 hypothetical protein [Staphylococcus phage vB_StaM_PB50]